MTERKGPVRFGIDGTPDGSAAVSVSRWGNISQNDKEAALNLAVSGLIGDARRSLPVDYAGPKRESGPAPAPGTGWRERGPLVSPPGVAIIDQMVDTMQPHGAANPEFRGAIPQAALRKAVAAARAVLAEEAAALAAEPEAAPISAEPEAECVAEPATAPAALVARAPGTLTRRKLA